MKYRILLCVVIIWLLTLNSTVSGQSPVHEIAQKLQEIDSTMYRNPAGAKAALLHLAKLYPAAPDSSKGLIYLKLATALGMTNNLDSGIWATREAIRMFEKKSLEKTCSFRMLAILYRLKGDYVNAESAITASLQINDSLVHDAYQKVITLQEYGNLCVDIRQFQKGTGMYLKALDIASTSGYKDPVGISTAVKLRINLAEAYIANKNYSFAIRELIPSLRLLDSLKDEEGYLRSGISLANSYLESGDLKSCDSLLIALNVLAKKIGNDELKAYVLHLKASALAARKEFRASLPFHREAFEILEKNRSAFLIECMNAYLEAMNTTSDHAEALRVIHNPIVVDAFENEEPYEQLNFKMNAIRFLRTELTREALEEYYTDIIRLQKKVSEQEQKNSATELQAKYQFDKQQESEQLLIRENSLLKEKAEFKRLQLFLFIAIAMLVIIILSMNLRRVRQRALLQSNELKAQQQEIRFQKDRSEWMEREKSFRDQLVNQQKIVLTQAIADKDEMSRKLKELVTENKEQRRIELLDQLEKSKDKKLNIEVLLSQFNAVYPTFASQLLKKFPKLSQADVQFCTLVRMNLTTKEISILLNIEPRSIYIKKYRTMEKMGLGENDDFENMVFEIG